MKYMAEINAFWHLAEINPLSTGQVALWFALMHINNTCNWIEWFTAPNQVLSTHTGLSRSGILKARNELKQRGMLMFKERGTRATAYRMNSLADRTPAPAMSNSVQVGAQAISVIANSTQVGVQDGTQVGVQVGAQNSTPLYKLDQTKQNETSSCCRERFGTSYPTEAVALCDYFEENCHQLRSLPLLNAITASLMGGAETEMVRAVIDETALAGPRSPAKYAVRILENLRGAQIWKLSAYQAQRKQYGKQNQGEREYGKSTVEGTFEGIQLDVTRL